jgi:voltage-gated potassium channel
MRPAAGETMQTLSSRNTNDSVRRVVVGLALLFGTLTLGTVGLMRLEGFSFIEAVYMTVITISTVGFGEIHDLSPEGRIFIMVLILLSFTILGYALRTLGAVIVAGQFRKLLGRGRMQRGLDKLRDHYIVCGYGRMGRIVCQALVQEGRPLVVITKDEAEVEKLLDGGLHAVLGDATDDEILLAAGVRRAKALVAVINDDVGNLYITLSARQLTAEENPDLYILARAADEKAMDKITRAGADRALSPYHIGGVRLVQALLRPTVFDYSEILNQGGEMSLMLEELKIGEHCDLVGRALRDTNLRQDYDIIVIGIVDAAGCMIFNPKPEQTIGAGDTLVVLGGRHHTEKLKRELAG